MIYRFPVNFKRHSICFLHASSQEVDTIICIEMENELRMDIIALAFSEQIIVFYLDDQVM